MSMINFTPDKMSLEDFQRLIRVTVENFKFYEEKSGPVLYFHGGYNIPFISTGAEGGHKIDERVLNSFVERFEKKCARKRAIATVWTIGYVFEVYLTFGFLISVVTRDAVDFLSAKN